MMPDPKPEQSEILRDLQYMTARWPELTEPALLEVRLFAEGKQPMVLRYAPDALDMAADDIARWNATGRNAYVVRNPIRVGAPAKGATDADILASFFLWADCDDREAASNVKRFDGPKYHAAVTTGRTPDTRVHIYWELNAPQTDMAAWRDMQTRIAAHFKSDPSVINPSRIMRIGGTVSWPDSKKQTKGYIDELVTIRTQYDEPRPRVSFDQMARVFGSQTLSQQAQTAAGLQIDTGTPQTLDRERARIQALSGQDWHNAVIRLVASYVSKGLSDDEIHGLTDPLTLDGYTVDQTRREVQTAIDGARRKGWTPEEYATPPEPEEWGEPTSRDLPAFEWFDDIEPALTDSYIIKGVLAQESMSVIYGPSNSGKTFLALDMAFSIATGTPWQGHRVRSASVLYLAAEGGRGIANRIAALKTVTGCVDVPLALRRAGMDLLHAQADLQAVYDLAQAVKSGRPDAPLLIVIDTLSRVMAGGDENSAADMTALIRNIDAIRHATGAHVMLVHHTGKDAARGARGHSSLRAATDTEIEVKNEGGARAAMVTKQRDYQGGQTFAFSLKSVALGIDQDGDEVTTCVVEAADADEFLAASGAAKTFGHNQQTILDVIDMLIDEGEYRPNPGGVGMPEAGRYKAVDRDRLREICAGKMADRSSFNKAFKSLDVKGGPICSGENLVWRMDRRI